jgi:hypothetical protein
MELDDYEWYRPVFVGIEGYEVTPEQWRQEREQKWPEAFFDDRERHEG